MAKKSTRAKLVAILDKLWSKAIHQKYHRCVVCGANGPLHAHHCIVNKGRGGYGVRWLITNGVLLCPTCHLFKIHHGQADKAWLDRYISILNDLIPSEEQQRISDISHRTNKFDIVDLREMAEEFRRFIK